VARSGRRSARRNNQSGIQGNAEVGVHRPAAAGPPAVKVPRPALVPQVHRPGKAFVPPTAAPPNPPLAPIPNPPAVAPIDSNAIARGCRKPSSLQIGVHGRTKDVGGAIPSWVEATARPNDQADGKARFVEGVLAEAHISGSDFPFKPWHTYYDWNYIVRPDPQYRNLLSVANDLDFRGQLECEWDTAFLPSYAWGQRGQRVWILGRWIFDCGHPTANGYRTEIHPPKAVVTFRSEAVKFLDNQGPTRATVASLYIGRRDSYITTNINDQDYEFNLRLPPKPFKTATPRVLIRSMTGVLPVNPVITPLPSAANATWLNVQVPLKGVVPQPNEYGLIVSGGWGDPNNTETKKIIKRKVTVTKIFMDANLDPVFRDEWYVYVCVNGRWKAFESLRGADATLNYVVNLDLHPTDKINLSLCGFEADSVHDLMGNQSGVNPGRVSAGSTDGQAASVAGQVRNAFVSGLLSGFPDENDSISRLFVQHAASDTGTFFVRPHDRDYRLRYKIDARN
jgi:hypothetical protein